MANQLNFMARRILTCMICGLLAINLSWAERVSQEDAAQVANNFMNSGPVAKNIMNATPAGGPRQGAPIKQRMAQSVKLMTLHKAAAAEENQYYLYENANGEGWVIVAADDVVRPILAYSHTGYFRTDNMPSNVKGWMRSYNDQIKYMVKTTPEASLEVKEEWTKLRTGAMVPKASVVVSPLIKTGWDQGEPYWDLCPVKEGKNCYSGCVATALAQVLNYWQWPKQGNGSHTIPETSYSANFGATTYDWDNMFQRYYYFENGSWHLVSGITDQQKTAVATLLYHCGVAVDMNYTPDGSGAFTIDYNGYYSGQGKMCAEKALTQFFRYNSSTVKGYDREGDGGLKKWTKDEWIAMLKDELNAGRPIMYAGYGYDDTEDSYYGHSFVCDGYDSDNKFHFNFGWSNFCDGYYELDKLETTDPGAGGGNGDYSLWQNVIVGIIPDNGGSQPSQTPTYHIYLYAPNACPEMKPGIIGDFNGWAKSEPMQEMKDSNNRTVYYYALQAEAGTQYKFREVTDTDWSNEIQYYENGWWYNPGNNVLGEETDVVFDWSDNTKYGYTKCAEKGKAPTTTQAVFDFTNPAALGIAEPASGTGTNITDPILVNGVTMSVTNGSTPTRIWNSNGNYDFRIYYGGSITLTSEIEITAVEFEGTTVAFNEFSGMSWTGQANSVTFTPAKTNKITKMTVTTGGSISVWTPDTISVAQARSLIDAGDTHDHYVEGVVVQQPTTISSGRVSFWIASSLESTDSIQAYSFYGQNNTSWESLESAQATLGIGDKVLLYTQKLQKYYDIYELNGGYYVETVSKVTPTPTEKDSVEYTFTNTISMKYYSGDPGDWYIRVEENNFAASIDVFTTNTASPVGEYPTISNFLAEYTGISLDNGDNFVEAKEASASIYERNDTLYVDARLVCGNTIYKLHMFGFVPKPFDNDATYNLSITFSDYTFSDNLLQAVNNDKGYKLAMRIYSPTETLAPGSYPINSSNKSGTVLASIGQSTSGGLYYSFVGRWNDYYYAPYWFLQSGTVVVDKDGTVYVDAVNSKGATVQCTAQKAPIPTYHIYLYAPDACPDMKPGIIGSFTNWEYSLPMQEMKDKENKTVYYYELQAEAGTQFKFREVTDTDWSNQIQWYDGNGNWYDFGNNSLGADTIVTFYYSDNTRYRYTLCEPVTNAISVAQAIEIANGLGDNGTSADEYTIEGYVVNSQKYNLKFGNQVWYMSDDPSNTAGQIFQAYGCVVYEKGEPKQVIDGDKVYLTGNITKYVPTSGGVNPEVKNGTATFISKAEGDHELPQPTQVSVNTALALGASLDAGQQTEDQYKVVGYVTSITQNAYASYGYMTFWIADEPSAAASNEDKAFYVYKGYPNEELQVGDRVSVLTAIKNYNGTLESETGAIVTLLEKNELIKAGIWDFTSMAASIDDWVVTNATLNEDKTDYVKKYVYDITGGIPSLTYAAAQPNILFRIQNGSDKTGAFTINLTRGYEFGGKNGVIIVRNTQPNDTITISVAAKGSTSGSFLDPNGEYPKNAVAITEDLTLPAKGSEGADESGYVWREISYQAYGGNVEIKEFYGGFRVRSITISREGEFDPSKPMTVAQAVQYINTLQANQPTSDDFTVIGYVSTTNTYDQTFNNQTFYIVDDLNNPTPELMAYYGTPTKNGAPYPVAYGDQVKLVGKLELYGTTPEIVRPTVEFLSEGSGDHSLPEIAEITVDQALNMLPPAGYVTRTTYDIVGYVSYIEEDAYSSFGNMTFWFAGDPKSTASSNAQGAMYAYRVYTDRSLEVGDKIRIRTHIRNSCKNYVDDQCTDSIAQTNTGIAVTFLERPGYDVKHVSITDNSIEEWNYLPEGYVYYSNCPYNAAYTGLKSMKVFADERYINLLVEPDYTVITDRSEVAFHVFLNTDNSDKTGGFGDLFTDANTDIVLESYIFESGDPYNYNADAYRWIGNVGGTGWEWDWLASSVSNSQYVNGMFEIQIDRNRIPATWDSNEFGIGVNIEPGNIAGFLPTVEPTAYNPNGHAHKLQVRYYLEGEQPKKHLYKISLYAPDACPDMKPGIIGDFTNWNYSLPMQEMKDKENRTYYYYELQAEEGTEFKFREVTADDWSNEIQYNDNGYWYAPDNNVLGSDTIVTYDWSDNTKYRFTLCDGSIRLSDIQIATQDSISFHLTWKSNYDNLKYQVETFVYGEGYTNIVKREVVNTTSYDYTTPLPGWYYCKVTPFDPETGDLLDDKAIYNPLWTEFAKTPVPYTSLLGVAEGHSLTFVWNSTLPYAYLALFRAEGEDYVFLANDTVTEPRFTYEVDKDGLYLIQLQPYIEYDEGQFNIIPGFYYHTSAQAFQGKTYSVQLSQTEGGYVFPEDLSGNYPENYELKVQAVTYYDYRFIGWSDGVLEAERTIIVTQDTVIQAMFEKMAYYKLTVSASNGGKIYASGMDDFGTSYSNTYREDISVYLEARADEGYSFYQWSDGYKDAQRYLTLTENTTLTAQFRPNVKLTINANNGWVSVSNNYLTVQDNVYTFVYGTEVQLEAKPNDGYRFAQWSDGEQTIQRTVVATSNQTLTAYFEEAGTRPQYYVYLYTTGNGSGTLNLKSGYYYQGDKLQLTATPSENSEFTGWSDNNKDNPRNITISDNLTLGANFDIKQISLTVQATAGGTVNEAVNGKYNYGASVQILATANEHYRFVQWSDGYTDADRYITLVRDTVLTAQFEAIPTYQLTVTAEEGGLIKAGDMLDYGTSFSQSYEQGAQVDIAAKANEGYVFTGWSDGSTEAQRTVTMNRARTITARFSKIVTLTLNASAGGSINLSGSYVSKAGNVYTLYAGTEVSLKAVPDDGYRFTGWSDNVTSILRTLTVNESQSIGAQFEPIGDKQLYTITILSQSIDGKGAGTVDVQTGVYVEGDVLTLTATPNSNSEFVGWLGETVTDNPRTIIVSKEATYTALFAIKHVSLKISASEGGTVNSDVNGSYEYGAIVSIIATANDHCKFLNWSDGDTKSSRYIYLTKDTNLVAQFEVEKYTITFKNYDGTVLEAKQWAYGETPTCSVTPTRPASGAITYVFAGWSPTVVAVTKDATYTATFREETKGFKVEFYDYNWTLIDEQEVNPGEAAVLPEEPKREGYQFNGWKIEDGEGTLENVQSDMIVRATYRKIEEGLEDAEVDTLVQKIYRDGHIYIIRGGKIYTLTGIKVEE